MTGAPDMLSFAQSADHVRSASVVPDQHGIESRVATDVEERARARPRVAMALYGDLTYDSRVRREAATLAAAGCDVSIVCLVAEGAGPDLPSSIKVRVTSPTRNSAAPRSPNPFYGQVGGPVAAAARRVRWLRDFVVDLRAWGRMAASVVGPVDVWHLHDLTALAAIVPVLSQQVAVVYDVHELFPEAGTSAMLPSPLRAALRSYERHLVARVSAMVTVNEGLAGELSRRLPTRRIEVVHNCPGRWAVPSEKPALLRQAAAIPADAPVILYHGNLSPDRGIEPLMESLLMPGLEDAHLVLLGMGPNRDRYAMAAAEPRWRGRAHVLDAVAPDELLWWVASADVGAMPIQASTLNHYLSTPNKLFECLAAGIPVVASDFPAMRRIVVGDPAGNLGAVCNPASAAEIGSALRAILNLGHDDTEALRARCAAAAQDRWNWEVQSRSLTRLYDELVGLTA